MVKLYLALIMVVMSLCTQIRVKVRIRLMSLCTQGNYSTRDSSGMCHSMPRWHLPEWREDERAFVHLGVMSLCTQGNYSTRDSSGMCHSMPRWHLPEWREDERAFVHLGSSIPNKGLDNSMPAIVNCIYKKSL